MSQTREPIFHTNLPNGSCPVPGILTAGQPSLEQIAQLAKSGVKTVIDLRSPDEPRGFDEPAAVRAAGMTYHNIPVSAANLGDGQFDEIRKLLSAGSERPLLVHCGSANRVGALLIPYLMLDEKRGDDEALRIASDIGLRSDDLKRVAVSYVHKRDQDRTAE